MAYYQRLGSVPPKRHTQHRTPEGGLYFEELMGEEGFFSDSSLLYHRYLPSAILDASPWEPGATQTSVNHPLRPRHLNSWARPAPPARTPTPPGPGPAAVAAPPSFPRVGDFASASRGFRQGESGILSG
jgi:hypothetical protein